MTVINRQADALPSSITPDELGKAMSQLDLSTVPPPLRAAAIMDHLSRIMADTIEDRALADELRAARILHLNKQYL